MRQLIIVSKDAHFVHVAIRARPMLMGNPVRTFACERCAQPRFGCTAVVRESIQALEPWKSFYYRRFYTETFMMQNNLKLLTSASRTKKTTLRREIEIAIDNGIRNRLRPIRSIQRPVKIVATYPRNCPCEFIEIRTVPQFSVAIFIFSFLFHRLTVRRETTPNDESIISLNVWRVHAARQLRTHVLHTRYMKTRHVTPSTSCFRGTWNGGTPLVARLTKAIY